MNKESVVDLLDRYQHNKCSNDEKILVEHWYDTLDPKDLAELSDTELAGMSDRILAKLNETATTPQHHSKSFKINWFKAGIAASVALALIFTALYNYNFSESSFIKENSGTQLLSKTNDTNRPLTLRLNDNSEVTLQPKAVLTYPTRFNAKKRMVYLKGDAFFSISKNPERPFYVYNKTLKVKVLGTSFTVTEATAQVAVRTGKVEVNENSKRKLFSFLSKERINGVLITPNQKAMLDEDHHKIHTALVDQPLPLSVAYSQNQPSDLNFSDTGLKDLFQALTKIYGITIKLENDKTTDCTFTGDISNKTLHEQLSLICQSVSATYKVEGTSILINASNCN